MAQSFATLLNGIRTHLNTNFSAHPYVFEDLTRLSDGTTAPPPLSQNKKWVRFVLDPNITDDMSSAFVNLEGFVIAQCFAPTRLGPEAVEGVADDAADAMRAALDSFLSGAGFFRPPTTKRVEPSDGYSQRNVRAEFWHQQTK